MGLKPGVDASEKRKFSYLSGIGPRFLGRPVCTLVTVPTELSRLPYVLVALRVVDAVSIRASVQIARCRAVDLSSAVRADFC
jgi:hypothetical protein